MLDSKYNEHIQKIFARYPDKRSAVMPLLYIAQEQYGHINRQSIEDVAELCELDPTQVNSIAGYYTMYRESPKGKYWLQVCTDLPCALRGADQFYEGLEKKLGLGHGKDTTDDGMFTVEHVTCLAACDKAPMLQCNFHFHEKLDLEKMDALIAEWREHAEKNGVASEPQGLP